MTQRILIAPAGWEDRYLKGFLIDMEQFRPTLILIPFSEVYQSRTLPIRETIKATAHKHGIAYEEFAIDYCNAVRLYEALRSLSSSFFSTATVVRFNATTTPRDAIWNILHFLSIDKTPTEFTYFRPLSYGEYLSRDAQAPRLVLKRSGISFPDRPTCILVLDGFDAERRAQLRNRYEPKVMLVGKQTGDQLENTVRNASNLLEHSEGEIHFDFDCYDTSDSSLSTLEEVIAEYLGEYNIIASSLGPKPSALTLFNLNRKYPDIGLVYIPASDYSEKYSSGIDESKPHLTSVTW